MSEWYTNVQNKGSQARVVPLASLGIAFRYRCGSIINQVPMCKWAKPLWRRRRQNSHEFYILINLNLRSNSTARRKSLSCTIRTRHSAGLLFADGVLIGRRCLILVLYRSSACRRKHAKFKTILQSSVRYIRSVSIRIRIYYLSGHISRNKGSIC